MTHEPFEMDVESLRNAIDAVIEWLTLCPEGETVYTLDEIRVSAHKNCQTCKGTGWVPK